MLRVVGILCVALFVETAFSADTYIPKDLNDAHQELLKIFSPKDIAHIKAMKKEDDMIEYHFGFGMGLRNDWGLWGGSRLSQWFNQHGIFHPDDMTGIIFDTFWDKLHDKPFKLEEKIAFYQKYWRDVGKQETH